MRYRVFKGVVRTRNRLAGTQMVITRAALGSILYLVAPPKLAPQGRGGEETASGVPIQTRSGEG